ncbi:MAG: BlaI/MecI/CopY family transcriptional regulator [Clostridium sp.]|jgi:BlaI family penicillinase repressor|nr:BlaI/MecI/CopY family transcriptional regulator [Clostridium sp.]
MERQITANEWIIMESLWEESPKTLMQIVKAMADKTGWAKSTVTTMVTRMESKGLLRYEYGGKAKDIYPAVMRDEVARQETRSLIDKVYNGSVGLLVSSLVENRLFTKHEIDELYAILRKAEQNEH